MELTCNRIVAVLRSILWVTALLLCVLLPHRWAWPFSALAATLLVWPIRRRWSELLARDGSLIVGTFVLLFAHTGLDPGWWLPWATVLLALTLVRHQLQRKPLLAMAAVPVIWFLALVVLWRPMILSIPSELPPANAVLVCAGDSLTSGVDGKSDANTYVAHLRKRLRCNVINAGRASDRVADLLARVDKDVISKRPDVVLLFIGGNDFMDGTPRDAFKRDFDSLVARIAANCPHIVIVEVPTGIIWNPYAGVYRSAAQRSGADFVPDSWLRFRFLVELLFRERLEEPMTIDGIHFSSSGAARVADWLEPTIRCSFDRLPHG